MTESMNHPGRLPEFLSRWHDGDLSAAERVRFESHRAHCSECRNAAAEFEQALALFRSQRPRPPAPELSSRILHKLQAANPRRSPLGVSFGIDLRWAGAFAAALIAVIIGSEVVVRREVEEHRRAREAMAINVVMDRKPSAPAIAAQSEAQSPKTAPAPPPSSRREKKAENSSKPVGRLFDFAPAPAFSVPAPQAAASAGSAAPAATVNAQRAQAEDLEKDKAIGLKSQKIAAARSSVQGKETSQQTTQRQALDSAASSPAGERQGGEGGTLGNLPADEKQASARFIVDALDGEGPAPALLNGERVDVPPQLRGREFDLVVEPSGKVLTVVPVPVSARGKALQKEGAGATRSDDLDLKTGHPLANLLFEPGERPRRLRVRID